MMDVLCTPIIINVFVTYVTDNIVCLYKFYRYLFILLYHILLFYICSNIFRILCKYYDL